MGRVEQGGWYQGNGSEWTREAVVSCSERESPLLLYISTFALADLRPDTT